MSGPRYRPKRRLRSELFPLAAILSLPVALYLAFPSGAIEFSPAGHPQVDSTYNAFVVLDGKREAQLLASARASWQSDSASRRGVRANLLNCGELSEGIRIASGLSPSVCHRDEPVVEYESDLLPSGLAAEGPKQLDADRPSESVPAFTKEDLLKLN